MMRVKFKDGSVVDYVQGDTASLVGTNLVIFDAEQNAVAELVAEEVESHEPVANEPEFGAAV